MQEGLFKNIIDAIRDWAKGLFLTDAPSDSKQYARKDGAWAEVQGGSGSSDLIVTDGDEGDFELSDPDGNVLLRLQDGHIRTKNFDSSALGTSSRIYDIILFMGQSNMAGRGAQSAAFPQVAPDIIDGAGYEFRAISDPTKLHKIVEPFGVSENKSGGINDGGKTGSMVTSFVNAYYETSGHPVIAISASEGGTGSSLWVSGSSRLNDAIQRLSDCKEFLSSKNISYKHIYMAWCQGETDGDNSVSADTYSSNFESMLDAMKLEGVEACFLVRIGECNGIKDYSNIINAQTLIAKSRNDVCMVSTALVSFKSLGLMKDSFHYYQQGYNLIGSYSGYNAGRYAISGGEPIMYDPKDNTIYYTNNSY